MSCRYTPGSEGVTSQVPWEEKGSVGSLAARMTQLLFKFLNSLEDSLICDIPCFRLLAKAPYQGSPSDATPVKKEMPESQPWLGLGPQTANPHLSLRQEQNQWSTIHLQNQDTNTPATRGQDHDHSLTSHVSSVLFLAYDSVVILFAWIHMLVWNVKKVADGETCMRITGAGAGLLAD